MELDALSVAFGVVVSAAALAIFKLMGKSKPAGKLHMVYFPIAGRGELCRLIAAAGGLELTEGKEVHDKTVYGSKSGLPLLSHGDLKISQSGAMENYLASLVPQFAALTPAQKAVDNMYTCIKEDVLAACANIVFNDIKNAPTQVPKVCDKWFGVIEGLLPSDGFVLGLSYPTLADLSILNIGRAYMPFGAAFKHGKYAYTPKFPKMAALIERTAASRNIAIYLASSKSLTLSFLDVDKAVPAKPV